MQLNWRICWSNYVERNQKFRPNFLKINQKEIYIEYMETKKTFLDLVLIQ